MTQQECMDLIVKRIPKGGSVKVGYDLWSFSVGERGVTIKCSVYVAQSQAETGKGYECDSFQGCYERYLHDHPFYEPVPIAEEDWDG